MIIRELSFVICHVIRVRVAQVTNTMDTCMQTAADASARQQCIDTDTKNALESSLGTAIDDATLYSYLEDAAQAALSSKVESNCCHCTTKQLLQVAACVDALPKTKTQSDMDGCVLVSGKVWQCILRT